MAGVVKGAPVRERIVSVGNREIVRVGGASEIDHAPAIIAHLEQKTGMILAQLAVDIVVGADCVVAHIGGVGALYPVRTRRPGNAFVPVIRRSMRMVAAIASLRNQVPVMLQHVEMVVGNQAFDFVLCPFFGGRNTQIDGLPFEFLRLPTGRKIGDHPVADLGIVHVERTRLGIQRGLRPVHPQAKLQSVLMGVVRNNRQAVRELLGVGVPVSHSAKPPRIDVEHLQPELSRVADHVLSDLFVDFHPAAPTVIHGQRVVGALPRQRIAEHSANPRPQDVACRIGSAVKRTQKDSRSVENFVRRQPGAKRSGIRIQPCRSFKRIALSFERQLRASAELDANVPAVLRTRSLLHEKPGDDFTWLVGSGVGVGAGCSLPFIAIANRDAVRANVGRRACAFFDEDLLEQAMGIDLPIELKAVLEREPDLAIIQILDANLVLNRTESRPRLPFPRETQTRRLVLINESHLARINRACCRF